jgi:hypothetical protein
VHRDVAGLAKWAGREADHILLRSRSHEDPPQWRPAHTINLTGNPNITSATYAKLIADTYTSLNKSSAGDPFWPTAAQLIIQHCLDALRLTRAPVTIPRVAWLIKEHRGPHGGYSGPLRKPSPRSENSCPGSRP